LIYIRKSTRLVRNSIVIYTVLTLKAVGKDE
jgi:hypothetical protein